MTREEAIKILDPESSAISSEDIVEKWETIKEMVREAHRMAISALRAQQTQLDRSRWEGCTHCDDGCCCTCKYSVTRPTFYPCRECDMGSKYDPQNYCPNCGRPLTEAAWVELERRMR